MVHLATLEPGGTANSETISQRTQVPQGYLSKVLRDLVVAGLIRSQRGPNGGFALDIEPSRISMLDVVNAVDPFKRIHSCPLGNPAHVKLCPLHQRIDDALDLIEKQFGRTMLSEVIETKARTGGQCSSLLSPTIRGRKH